MGAGLGSTINIDVDSNINPFSVTALADTGSTYDLLNCELVPKDSINYSDVVQLRSANGSSIHVCGSFITQVKCDHAIINTKFYVVTNMARQCILGLSSCKALNIIPESFPHPQINEVNMVEDNEVDKLREYIFEKIKSVTDVFDNTGPIKAMNFPKCQLKLRSDIKIVPHRVKTCRRSPFGRGPAEKKELDALEEKKVIRKLGTSETVEWLAGSHFVAKKDGSLRLVVNQIKLNKQLVRNAITFDTPFHQATCIPKDHKFFISMDVLKAYFQVEYDEESQRLCAFLTPWGAYTFIRTVMGNVTSSDCLITRLSEAFTEMTEVLCFYVDDILLSEKTVEELIVVFDKTVDRCKKYGIQISKAPAKIQCGREVIWAGLKVKEGGFEMDPKRYEAIKNFQPPIDKSELRSFLGTVNQFSQFVPDIAFMYPKMSQLLKKNVTYNFLPEHEAEFKLCKKAILSGNKCMAYYDINKDLLVYTDASLAGLGWCALQRSDESNMNSPKKLITCGSRRLRPNECQWPILHLELLAIATALRKMRLYTLFNSKLKVFTDHLPLKTMCSDTGLESEASKRVLFLKEQLSEFTFTIDHIKGKDNPISDLLSRRCLWGSNDDTEKYDEVLEISDIAMFEDIFKEANSCHEYQILKKHVQSKKHFKDLILSEQERAILSPFKRLWGHLSVNFNIVFMKKRQVIPRRLRSDIIKNLHISHNGVRRTIQTCRNYYYWPFFQADIENVITSCAQCLEFSKSKPLEPIVHQVAKRPMHILGVDIFFCDQQPYIAVRDTFSEYLWCEKLVNMTSTRVIEILQGIFYTHGSCAELKHDGQSTFTSEEFERFAKFWQFQSKLTSPYNSRSNGISESGVKAAKLLLKKCNLDMQKFKVSLLQYNNTAIQHFGLPSPFQLLMGRPGRTFLPLTDEQFEPLSDEQWRGIHIAIKKRDEIMINNFGGRLDRSGFAPGDKVLVQSRESKTHPDYKKWNIPATIIEHVNNRSYVLKRDTDGVIFIRNQRFLKYNMAEQNDIFKRFVPQNSDITDPLRAVRNREGKEETAQSRPVRIRQKPVHHKDYIPH